jgi:two-component system, NarL family, nitrate/nitrite response regulator NarL
MITLAAIDDDRMLLAGLRAWLGPVDGIELTTTAATVDEYLDTGPAPADVVLLDLNLRDGSTPAANVARLLDIGAAVLVVSTIPDAGHVLATIEAGAAGYVTKDNDLPALVSAIRDVAAGGTAVSPELAFVLSTDRRPERPRLSANTWSASSASTPTRDGRPAPSSTWWNGPAKTGSNSTG